jgi:anti-anti-sigma regulatory factor
MPVTVAQSETLCLIRLEGELNIASAAELKKLLLEALAGEAELQVELGNAAELDVTILQLLWAGERAARVAGKGFALAGSVPEQIAIAVAEAGLARFPVATDPKAAPK